MEFESTPDNDDANGGGGNNKSNNNNNNNNNDTSGETNGAKKKKKPPRFSLTIDVDPSVAPASSIASGRSTGENSPILGYDGTKIPFKPALKSASSMDESDNDVDDQKGGDGGGGTFNNPKKKKKAKKKNRTLKWDEAKIEEHDKLRGTRMKIEEPNTPFAASYYDSGSETDCSMTSRGNNSVSSANANNNGSGSKISWDALTNKLEAHAAVATMYPPSSPSSHGGNTTEDNDRGNCTTEDDEAEDPATKRERQRREMRRLEFQEHRKRHYNEMEVVRRFRRDHPDGRPSHNGSHSSANSSVTHGTDDDSDDDDSDDDDDDEMENNNNHNITDDDDSTIGPINL